MIEPYLLGVQHSSLEFSDPSVQQESDIHDLFRFGQKFPIKTGTESGPERSNSNRENLKKYADFFNHEITFAADTWVAVDRKIAEPGSFKAGHVLTQGDLAEGTRGGPRDMAYLTFMHVEEGVGLISQLAAHFAIKGQDPGDPNHELNMRQARDITKWMTRMGRGNALAFVNGDFNMSDRKYDWAFSGKWTSMADELKQYHDTGHGAIDGLNSYDYDGRVEAVSYRVLDDEVFPQFHDHFVLRGVWGIKKLAR